MIEINREECLAAIEKLIALLRARPEIGIPHNWIMPMGLSIYADTREELLRMRKAFGPGKWEKSTDESFYSLRRELMPGLAVYLTIWKAAICKQIVERVLVPAVQTPAVDTPEHYEHKVTWECPDSILEDSREPVPAPD